jgi:DNA-binding MarR family transcriptional regulator
MAEVEFSTFLALGMSELDARILAAIIAAEEVTAATLCAVTGERAPKISVAVENLIRRGLVERVRNRRPSLIFMNPAAPDVLARLAAEAKQEHEQRLADVDLAVEAVTQASARREARGRPYYELDPRRNRDSDDFVWRERRGRTSHDEVVWSMDVTLGGAPRSFLGCPTRLLITDSELDPELAARGQQPGSEVRSTDEALPRLLVIDGTRAGITSGTQYGQMLVWSRDALHVRAAEQLFGLWWDEAAPGAVTPYPEPKPPEEENWDVDERDPNELASG